MNQHTCPTCGHRRRVSTKVAAPVVADVSSMTDAELYAYRKATAPQEDARFFLNVMRDSLTPEHRARLSALATGNGKRTDVLRELRAIQSAHFQARIAAEYASRRVAIAA